MSAVKTTHALPALLKIQKISNKKIIFSWFFHEKNGSSIQFESLDRVHNKKYSKKFVIKYFTVRTRVKGSTSALTISHTNTIKFLSFPANYTDRKLYMLTSKGQGHKKMD